MKKRLKILLTCMVLLCCLHLSGCMHYREYKAMLHPTGQPGSTWVSEDGQARFQIDTENPIQPALGIIQTDDGPVEVGFHLSGLTGGVGISFAEELQKEDSPIYCFANGVSYWQSNSKIEIEIISADCFFESGEKIIFFRTE